MRVPFNKPYFSGKELDYIQQAVALSKLSGNGQFTKKCQKYFEDRYGFTKTFLTTSCTDALEMAAILCDINPGDEVIIPSYTFVSTANAFMLRGAKVVFADSCAEHPNISPLEIERLITPKTKAVCIVHYAGMACDMDAILKITEKNNLFLVEDAAQAIDSCYNGKPLGSFGHFAAFSFHETKNISCGEGGMLVVNDKKHIKRAEIIWEKGTDRAAFWRGETDKYTWKDIGSSFLPSELNAACLLAQLDELDAIQEKRKKLWNLYYKSLTAINNNHFTIAKNNETNGHLFYLTCKNEKEKNELIEYLNKEDINAIFHYLPLHSSPYFVAESNSTKNLPNAEKYGKCLVRLPLHYYLSEKEIDFVCEAIEKYYVAK